MQSFDLQIQFEDDSRETAEVYVEAKIQGDNLRFLLDTGCAKTSLNFNNFSSQFEKIGSQESSGVFGRTNYDLISVASIELGTIIKNELVLSRAKKGELDRNLLGMDILKDYCLKFSFDSGKVEVHSELFDENITIQDLILDKGSIPYLKFEHDGSDFMAIWDTGASVTLVDIHLTKEHPTMFEQIGIDIGTDSTGSQMETPMYLMKPISLGNKVFPPHKVAAVNLAHVNSHIEIPMDFIFGFSTLKNAIWIFDFPQKKWTIEKMIIQ